MQYQLSFAAGPGAPDRAAFERYFTGRPRWTVDKGHARYQHDDTGVTFGFHYATGPAGTDAQPRPWAVFALALPRASFFAEEATHELSAFVARFGAALIPSPHASMATFTVPDFQRSWEEVSRAACARLSVTSHEPPFPMPRSRLLTSWKWNAGRRALQDQEGDVFVPRVWFIRTAGGVGTCVIWPDAMAVRVPQADHVIFSRDELAPRTRLGRRPDVAVAPWSLIAPSITGDAFFDHQLANWRVTDPRVLKGVMRLVSKLRGATDMPEFLPPDAVLDEEWFVRSRKSG